jgi:hypothetical protein
LNKVSTIPVQKADGVDTVEGILLGAAAWLATSIGVAIGWSRFHLVTVSPAHQGATATHAAFHACFANTCEAKH